MSTRYQELRSWHGEKMPSTGSMFFIWVMDLLPQDYMGHLYLALFYKCTKVLGIWTAHLLSQLLEGVLTTAITGRLWDEPGILIAFLSLSRIRDFDLGPSTKATNWENCFGAEVPVSARKALMHPSKFTFSGPGWSVPDCPVLGLLLLGGVVHSSRCAGGV